MKIVVPILLLSTAWLGAAGCHRQGPALPAAPPEDLPGPLQGMMSCLVDEHGIRRKVVTRRPEVMVAREPGGPPAGKPLRHFFPHFIFAFHPNEKSPELVEVGSTPRRDSILGWVRWDDVAPWSTRIGVRNLARIEVYAKFEDVVELARTGRAAAKPMAVAERPTRRTWMPWPVAETKLIEHRGGAIECARLLFLGEVPEEESGRASEALIAMPAYSSIQVAAFQQGVRALDVVFVVDATGSMQPFIQAAKETIRQVSEALRGLPFRPDVAFGFVLYRDYDPESKFVTQVLDLERDYAAFLRRLSNVEAGGGGDESEAVFDGVEAALEKISWRGQGLSTRVAILVGDSPAHEPGDPQNPRGIRAEDLTLLARRQDRHVVIFSLAVGGRGGEAKELRWRQFEFLARETGGTCQALENSGALVGKVETIVRGQSAIVERRSSVLDGLAAGKSREEIARSRPGLGIHEVTEVMQFLEGAGLDLRRIGRGAPCFASGWCLVEDRDGRILLEKQVYAARAELDILLGELYVLQNRFSPDIARQAFDCALGSRLGEVSFFSRERTEPMDVYLMARGVYPGQGVLRLTREEIEHMAEGRRAVLRDRIVREVIPGLLAARNDDLSFTRFDDLELGWVPEALFP